MRPPSFRLLAPAVLLLAVMAAAASAAPIKDRDEPSAAPFVLAIDDRMMLRLDGFFDAFRAALAEAERARKSKAEASQRATAAERNASVAEAAAERAEKIAAAATAEAEKEAAAAIAKAARTKAASADAIARAEKEAADAAAKAARRAAAKLEGDAEKREARVEREEAAAEREARRKARQAARADGRKARGGHEEPDRDLPQLVEEPVPAPLQDLAASLIIDGMAATGSAPASAVVPATASTTAPLSETPPPSTSSTLLASLPVEAPLSLGDVAGRDERIAVLSGSSEGPLAAASAMAAQGLAGVATPPTALSLISGLIGILLIRRSRQR
jgi:hypothetical protein